MIEEYLAKTDNRDKCTHLKPDQQIKGHWHIEVITFDKKYKIPFTGTFEEAREKAIKLLN